jgi:hypothetical protein
MLSPQILVADLLDTSPLIARLLFELRVDCLGCSMNKFCTLEELCAHYDLELQSVLSKVQERLNICTD